MNALKCLRTVMAATLLAGLCLSTATRADDQSAADAADAIVQKVSGEVLTLLRHDKDLQAGNTQKLHDLIETKILPQFDFNRMTALAVGVDWRKANAEQKKQLVEQFRTLLVRTYSSGLSSYRDQVLEFKPLRSKPTDTDVLVRSEIKQPGTQPISIDYRMGKSDAGWRIYDVIIGGVSLVTTYRDTFVQEVRQNGIDGLVKMLSDKNRTLEQAARK